MDLKEDAILGSDIGTHWYYKSKAIAITKYLDSIPADKILDVGAGSGFFSRYLMEKFHSSEVVCVDTGYEESRLETVKGGSVRFEPECTSFNADLVLLMDVLEHVDDDVGLLKYYMDVVPDGAYFMITVPAFQFMWSGHDEFLEHRRRYNLSMLQTAVEAAGLEIEKSSYYFGGVFPMALVTRIAQRLLGRNEGPRSQLKRHSWLVNQMLYSLCLAELPFLELNKLAGLSVFCLARK